MNEPQASDPVGVLRELHWAIDSLYSALADYKSRTLLDFRTAKAINHLGRAIRENKVWNAIHELEGLKEEVQVLRLYGNHDCTAMADEELKRRQLAAEGGSTGEQTDSGSAQDVSVPSPVPAGG